MTLLDDCLVHDEVFEYILNAPTQYSWASPMNETYVHYGHDEIYYGHPPSKSNVMRRAMQGFHDEDTYQKNLNTMSQHENAAPVDFEEAVANRQAQLAQSAQALEELRGIALGDLTTTDGSLAVQILDRYSGENPTMTAFDFNNAIDIIARWRNLG